MNEFIEKLIGRLEELNQSQIKKYTERLCKGNLACIYDKTDIEDAKVKTTYEIIQIVNQLAEEYKDKVMINGQYCWQTCGATEHCKECNRLCNGSIDYYENYDVLAEEYNNDFCEWTKQDGLYLHRTSCGTEDTYDDSYKFCPYCGKKIKVVE